MTINIDKTQRAGVGFAGARTAHLYVIVSVSSLVAFWMYRSNINFYVFAHGGGQFQISMFEAAYFLPSLFITYLGGVIADRNRHIALWLIALVVATAGLLAAVAITVATFDFPFTGLLILTGLIGVVGALRTPSATVFVRALVPTSRIAKTNALLSAGFNLARIAGPIVVGVLSIALTTEAIFVVLPLFSLPMLLFMILCARGIVRTRAAVTGPAPSSDPVAARMPPEFPWFLATIVVFFFASNLIWTSLPFVLERIQLGTQDFFSYSYALFGAGAVLGSMLQPKLYTSGGAPACFLLGGLAYGSFYGASLAPEAAPVLIAIFMSGFGMGVFYSTINTHVLLSADYRRHGRRLALSTLLTNGSLACGSLALSYISDRHSETIAKLVAIVLLFGLTPAMTFMIWRKSK
jgi:predicted MFS family arabinose efflux permease